KDGFGSLPDDAVAKAYANGPQLSKLFTSLSGATTAAFDSTQPKLDWLAASVVPEDNGLKLEVDVKSPNARDFTGDPYSSNLNFGPVTARWAGFDGRVLITTSPTGIDDYRSGGDKLADDSMYKDALDAAGVPDQTLGQIYLNLGDAAELIKSYAGLSGEKLPP